MLDLETARLIPNNMHETAIVEADYLQYHNQE